MKINIKLWCIITLFALLFSCNNTSKTEKKEIDPFEAAMPHGKSLPDQELSEADKLKLAKAIGKSVQEISFKTLLEKLEDPSGKLSIINFWKLDCASCKTTNLNLQKIQHELGNDKLNLSLVNLDSTRNKEAINAYIRANNLTADVFLLKENRPVDWEKKIVRSWDGKLPAFYLINKHDGTDLFYQQEMSYGELFAVIQSLSLSL